MYIFFHLCRGFLIISRSTSDIAAQIENERTRAKEETLEDAVR